MSDSLRILVVAATARELAASPLAPADPLGSVSWRSLLCGIGPVEAATATARAIAQERPLAVLHVGIAGVRRERALGLASLVIGDQAYYCDLDVPASWAPRAVDASPVLMAAARRVLPDAPVMRIGTSARVGGTAGVDVEAMEGFGVLRAAEQAGVPAIEIRAISNEIEETNRARWAFDAAFAAITEATPRLIAEMYRS